MTSTPHHPGSQRCGLDALGRFDEIVDVRTPVEYVDDHFPMSTLRQAHGPRSGKTG